MRIDLTVERKQEIIEIKQKGNLKRKSRGLGAIWNFDFY